MSVFGVCVPSRKPRFQLDRRLLVEERIANIGMPLDFFGFLLFQLFFVFYFFGVFGSLQAKLLCIMGELVGAGSVAVAVCVSDR